MKALCQDGFHNRSSSILARIPNNKAVALENKILGKLFRIRMFLGLPEPFVTSTDPVPDPSVIKKK